MKLTKAQRELIKVSEKTNTELAKEFGVSAAAISKLRKVNRTVNETKINLTFTEHEVVITIPKRLLIKPLLAPVLAQLA